MRVGYLLQPGEECAGYRKLLVPHEKDWLNAYHKRVLREIGPSLKGEVKAWLKEATRAI